MQLKRKQKVMLLSWIAEGLGTPEINELAAKFKPPFSVVKQQVDYYRRTRNVELDTIRRMDEREALAEGYAKKEERVHKLSILAALLENDLFGGMLWLDDVKGVGAGAAAITVDFEKFNDGEVAAYRGLLDDIAKEVGGRVTKQDITSGGQPISISTIEAVRPDDAPDRDDDNSDIAS